MNIIAPTPELAPKISAGLVDGIEDWRMLGERPNSTNDAAGEDVSDIVAVRLPIPPDAGDLISFKSSNAADNPAGTGVAKVRIVYLDANGDEQEVEFATDGVTNVNTNIQMRFLQYCHAVNPVGTNTAAVGNIDFYKTGDTATVYNRIGAGGNFSLSCARMVPAGKTLLITNWNASQGSNQTVPVRLRSTSDGLKVYDRTFLFKDTITLQLAAQSHLLNPPIPVPALAIVKVSGWPGSAGAIMSSSAVGYLYDNATFGIVYPA